jgi:hypothetical protein
MPAAAGQWRLKKHDGRAEAALLALYGLRERHISGEKALRSGSGQSVTQAGS